MSAKHKRWILTVCAPILAASIGGMAGCAHRPTRPVQPWQREHLAKRAMQFEDTDAHFKQHLFGAREGSDLGYGQPGGGCGCN